MKKVTAYINITRIHWLVEELQSMGIDEAMVTEYYKPLSQVARLELLCQDAEVANVKAIIHRVGTTGGPPPDHDIIVSQHDTQRVRLLPMTIRLDPLEESRLKQFIENVFRNVRKRLVFTFSVAALSIACIALFLHLRIENVQVAAREASRNARVITEATKQIQTAHFEQLLAAERLHSGEMSISPQQFKQASVNLEAAAIVLRQSHSFDQTAVDSVVALERRFQFMMNSMFEIITTLSDVRYKNNSDENTRLSQSHADVMIAMDKVHVKSMEMLVSLEKSANSVALKKELQSEEALRLVRLTLTILTGLSFIIAMTMWFVVRQKVTNPIQALVEEAKTLDAKGLK